MSTEEMIDNKDRIIKYKMITMSKVIFRKVFMIAILFMILAIFFSRSFSQSISDSGFNIIPKPVSVQLKEGHFLLSEETDVVIEGKDALRVAKMLVKELSTPTGLYLSIRKEKKTVGNSIKLKFNDKPDKRIDSAGYTLKVDERQIKIVANTSRGLFYGVQTLLQLLPPQIESKKLIKNTSWRIPCVDILDFPRVPWRGLMLDVSRHFFTKEQVKKYIDEMSKYKFNVFHWHLTDDHGWRIQIDGLPQLTKVGAWRAPRMGTGPFTPPHPNENATYGGFYTQKDIREIVSYAQDRYITILPEIDVPGHSRALIASYPNLSCTGEQYPVSAPVTKFSHKIDNVLCTAKPLVWYVLDTIFSQVANLFPGEYIHVGGDEVSREFWAKDPNDIMLMKDKGFRDLDELKNYFENRIHKIITSKGKKMIGWDEITKGEIAKGVAVMCRKPNITGKNITKPTKMVLTTGKNTYLDYYQGDPLREPKAHSSMNLLSSSYGFNLFPKNLDSNITVIGGEGCLWTEYVPNYRHAEYMTWPRAMALAEVLWSPKDKHDWIDFIGKMKKHFDRLDYSKVKYSKSVYDPIIMGINSSNDSLKIVLKTEIPGLDIYYRFDGTDPDRFAHKYSTPISIPKGATEIKTVTYYNNQRVGHQINCPINVIKERMEESFGEKWKFYWKIEP